MVLLWKILYVLACENDMIICCQSKEDVQEMAENLNKEVEVKQLREVNHYLGIKIEMTKSRNFLLSWRQNIVELIEPLGLKDAKVLSSSFKSAYLSLKDRKLLESNQQYREIIDKLLSDHRV